MKVPGIFNLFNTVHIIYENKLTSQQYKSEPLKHIKEDDDSIYKFYQQSYLLKNPQFVESLRKSPKYLDLVESVENFLTEMRQTKKLHKH